MRRVVLATMAVLLGVALLAGAGCGPQAPTAAELKQQCFDNQLRIKQAEDLMFSDSQLYAPIGDVTSKINAKCPSGGTYTFDTTTDKVTCSVHGSAPGQ